MNLGDIFFELRGTSGTLEIDAKKEAEAAGFAAGAAFSASFAGKLKASTSGIVAAGIGLEIGKQLLHGLESALDSVVNILPGMISQGEAFALTVDDISDSTRASAETASRFAGTLTYLGISTSGLGMAFKTLSADVVDNESKFKKLRITTRDSNGDLLDTVTILDNVRRYLSTTGDGATKLRLATDLLGKSAAQFIDYLNLTDEQARFLNTMLDNLAVTMGGDTVRAAESLKREQNLLGLAWQGLSNTLMTAVIPAIRQFVGGVIEFVATHGPQLRQMLSDITNTVLGFASALVGVSGVTPFQMQMDALGGSTANVALSFEQWAQQMGYTIPKITQATGSTKTNTTAIDAQIKSVQKAIDTEKRRSDTLTAAIDLQLAQLDLSERQIAIDQRRHDLNAQLNQAQLDLAKAQGSGNAQAISDAMAAVADIVAQQAENERQLGVDAQRDKLQQQRDEITAKSKARQDELTALKTSLDEQRSAMQAAGAKQVSDNQTTLKTLKAQHQAYLTNQRGLLLDHVGVMENLINGDPKTGTGLGGAMTKAFADGTTAGQDFRTFLTDQLMPAVQSIVDIFGGLVGLLKGTADELKWLSNPNLSWEGILGKDLTPPALRDQPPPGTPGGGTSGGGGGGAGGGWRATKPTKAFGGPVWAGTMFIGNEKRQEFWAPENGTVIPSIGAARGLLADAGGTLVVEHLSLDLGGTRVGEWVDQRLALKRRV